MKPRPRPRKEDTPRACRRVPTDAAARTCRCTRTPRTRRTSGTPAERCVAVSGHGVGGNWSLAAPSDLRACSRRMQAQRSSRPSSPKRSSAARSARSCRSVHMLVASGCRSPKRFPSTPLIASIPAQMKFFALYRRADSTSRGIQVLWLLSPRFRGILPAPAVGRHWLQTAWL